jgi:hypothetical protein
MHPVQTFQSPEQTNEHLSPIAAKMILAALPDRIQHALLSHAAETEYPVEMVLEMAIAGFLDSEAVTFDDCYPEYK